jgi:hypothetical protein
MIEKLRHNFVGRMLAADIAILQLLIGIATALTPGRVWTTSYPTIAIVPQALTAIVFIAVGCLGLFAAATNRLRLRQKFLLFEIFLFVAMSFSFWGDHNPIGVATYLCLAYMSAVRFIRLSMVRGEGEGGRYKHR